MIDTIEKLLQDYASYSFMEGTIDENTMNHLVEDSQNYVAKLNELNLLSLHHVSQQRELLLDFLSKINGNLITHSHLQMNTDFVDEYIKSNNCG